MSRINEDQQDCTVGGAVLQTTSQSLQSAETNDSLNTLDLRYLLADK